MEKDEKREEPGVSKADAYFFSGCFGLFFGGIIGCAGGFVLPLIYYRVTNPRILEDGQWGMIYLLTLPVGILIGAILGCALGCILVAKAQKRN